MIIYCQQFKNSTRKVFQYMDNNKLDIITNLFEKKKK